MAQSIARSIQPAPDLSRAAVLVLAIAQVAAAAMQAVGLGTPIGEQSDAIRTLITPAGWAFSIWGVLYTGAFVFAIYQALPSQRDNAYVRGLRWPAALAFLGNALWALYVQLVDLGAISVAIIFLSLGALLVALKHMTSWTRPLSAGDRWCVRLPLSALAAWLTAATIVNIAASLRFHGIEADASAAPLIAAGVLALGGAIAGTALARSWGNLPFALVFLWALAAIYAAGGQLFSWVAYATIFAALETLVGTVIGRRLERTRRARDSN